MYFHISLYQGWGRTVHCDPRSVNPILQETSLQIVSDSTCETANGIVQEFNLTTGTCLTKKRSFAGLITEGMLCAKPIGQGTFCDKDDGGPFTVQEGDQHSLVGVVSFAFDCASVRIFVYKT